jgi:predicted phosphodiesterase
VKVGILGDLHIGSIYSKWSDAAALIKNIARDLDALIIVGDVTEELNPYPKTLSYVADDREKLKSKIQRLLNQFLNAIGGAINRVAFLRGNHDDQVLNNCSLVEDYAVLHSQFGRVVVLHGHQTNLSQYGLKLGWGVQAGRALKNQLELEQFAGIQLQASDYLIVGHCHVVYSDIQAKIYSPGCWVGNYSNRNVGWYILIDDETFNSPKAFIRVRRKPNLAYSATCKCGYSPLTQDSLVCPVCNRELTPRCGKSYCDRPLRGEEEMVCKKHNGVYRFWE